MIRQLVPSDDPILRRPTDRFMFQTLEELEQAKQLAIDLTETMLHHNGLGLAAPQIGQSIRAFVIKSNPVIAVFNPIIVDLSEQMVDLEEGCLSFPNLILKINRPGSIRVRYTRPNGEVVTEKYTGMTARVFQHEMDHLDGKLFTKKVSALQLDIAKRKMKKRAK